MQIFPKYSLYLSVFKAEFKLDNLFSYMPELEEWARVECLILEGIT